MLLLDKQSPGSSGATDRTDKPPPYMDIPNVPEPSRSNGNALVQVRHAVGMLAPPPTVNQVHLEARNEPISGTFYIDPQIPNSSLGKKKKSKCGKHASDASFRSHKGPISLELATTGSVSRTQRATVNVTTRSGDVSINLLPIHPSQPRMGLDVYSRKGNTLLYIPPTFSGVIHLTTRKGELTMLPRLSASMKILKSTNKEVLVMVGSQSVDSTGNAPVADLCQLKSHSGNIVVGLAGQDKYSPPVGFWKRMGEFFNAGL